MKHEIVSAATDAWAATPGAHARRRRPHVLVYFGIICLLVWMIAAAWGFAGTGRSDAALSMVSIFGGIAVILPLVLWHLGHSTFFGRRPLKEWLSGDLEIWQGRLPARLALIDILTIPASAALGMTALALVFHFAGGGAG